MGCDIKEGFWPSFYLKENKTIFVSINNHVNNKLGEMMSSTPENILNFRKCAMVVLNLLYESFPMAINIDAFYIEGEGKKLSIEF